MLRCAKLWAGDSLWQLDSFQFFVHCIISYCMNCKVRPTSMPAVLEWYEFPSLNRGQNVLEISVTHTVQTKRTVLASHAFISWLIGSMYFVQFSEITTSECYIILLRLPVQFFARTFSITLRRRGLTSRSGAALSLLVFPFHFAQPRASRASMRTNLLYYNAARASRGPFRVKGRGGRSSPSVLAPGAA